MINIKEDKNLSVLNHSCAHLMAQAVKHLYPNAKFWVGPVVEEGFYYDMDLGDTVLTEEDIEKHLGYSVLSSIPEYANVNIEKEKKSEKRRRKHAK